MRRADLPKPQYRRMLVGSLILPLAMASLVACSTSTPVAYRGLASSGMLRPDRSDVRPFSYVSAGAQLNRKILIDPVTIYAGSDAQFGSVSDADRQIVANYLYNQFEKVLAWRFQIADVPGPDTVRVHLTLTGIGTSTPVLSTISHVAPADLVVNGMLMAAGDNGTFFGSVSYAAELSDASTGKLLFAYVTKQNPAALDLAASFGTLDAAKASVRDGARQLRDELTECGMLETVPQPTLAEANP